MDSFLLSYSADDQLGIFFPNTMQGRASVYGSGLKTNSEWRFMHQLELIYLSQGSWWYSHLSKRESLRQSWMIMLRMRKMSSCMLLILEAPSAGTKMERLAETQFLLLDSLPFTGVDRFSTIIHQNLGDLSNNGQSFNWPFILLGTLQIVWCALTSSVLQGTYEIHSIIPSFYW